MIEFNPMRKQIIALFYVLAAVLSLAVSPVAVAARYGVGTITDALSHCTGDEFDATCNIIFSVIAIVIIVAVGFLIYCFWEMFVKPAHVKFASPRQEFVSPNGDLMAAAARGDAEGIRNAFSRRAKPDTLNQEGETPLMVAAFHGHTEAVKMLLLMGANPHAKNRKGDTALDYAKVEKHATIITILEMMGIQ